MITRLSRFSRAIGTVRGRRRLAGHSLVAALVMSLLLIPSTCAHMAGPHSIFTDPNGGHGHHHHHATEPNDVPLRSIAELEWHVISGDGSPGWALAESAEADEECPTVPRLHDLPSTMAMGATSAPATLDNDLRLDLPVSDEPAETGMRPLHATFYLVDPPPPR